MDLYGIGLGLISMANLQIGDGAVKIDWKISLIASFDIKG